MHLESSEPERQGRRDFRLLLLSNLLLIALLASAAIWLAGQAHLVQRVGRGGPLGTLLLFGVGAWAWAEVLLLPLLNARRAFSRPIPREP